MNLPETVRRYLSDRGIVQRHVAFVLVDGRGVVTEWGGAKEILAPKHVEPGEKVVDALPDLAGIFPFSGEPLVVPTLQIDGGPVVHLHVFATDRGAGLVLFDAAPEFEETRQRQQQEHDRALELRRERRDRR